jgi:hypothetical protein
MQTAPSTQSTATRTTPATTFKPRVRRLGPGRYLVESSSKPGTGHPVTASSCPCKGFAYRGSCRHVALVQALEPSMTAWYDQAAPSSAPVVVPMTAGAPSGIVRPVMATPVSTIDNALDDADRRLGAAYRALADAHEQSDERAVLLRQVDSLEREIAALHSQAIRYAA